MKPERLRELAIQCAPNCTCHEGYTSRGLIDPMCFHHETIELFEDAIRLAYAEGMTDAAGSEQMRQSIIQLVSCLRAACSYVSTIECHDTWNKVCKDAEQAIIAKRDELAGETGDKSKGVAR
jgi:hypothetical protein